MTASLCYEALDSVFHCPLLKPLLYQDRIWFKLKYGTRNFFQVPIFSTRKTNFQLAFCEFASVSFEPCKVNMSAKFDEEAHNGLFSIVFTSLLSCLL